MLEGYYGLYPAVLEEDFIETVKEKKKPFLKARISPYYDEVSEYPLTFVASQFFIYPLAEGDEVIVAFRNGDLQRPYLYSANYELPDEFLNKVELPTASNFSVPTAEDNFSASFYGEGCYLLYTDTYAVLKYGNSIRLFKEGQVIEFNDEYDLKSTKVVWELPASGGEINISSNGQIMKSLMDSLLSEIIAIQTVGAPTVHYLSPTSITNFTAIKLNWNIFFGGA